MGWLRWYHGTADDPVLRLVAHKADQPLAVVLGVWVYILEYASTNNERGSIKGIDLEVAAFSLGISVEDLQAIWSAIQDRGLITSDRITDWDKTQPMTNAERARRYRAKQSEKGS